MLIENIVSKRATVCSYLNRKKSGKALFVFDHGLGDFIMFFQIYEVLKKKYPNWEFNIGCHPMIQVKGLHEDIVILNKTKGKHDRPSVFKDTFKEKYDSSYIKEYDYIFVLKFPEQPMNSKLKKFQNVAKLEFGLDVDWGNWRPKIKPVKNSNMVGIHFIGNTAYSKKSLMDGGPEIVWNDVKAMGYDPFEIHMNVPMLPHYCVQPIPKWMNGNTMRESGGTIIDMMNKIAECKYFIGINSGPMWLAGEILGWDRCIMMNKIKEYTRYFPYKLYTLNIDTATNSVPLGSIKKALKVLNRKVN